MQTRIYGSVVKAAQVLTLMVFAGRVMAQPTLPNAVPMPGPEIQYLNQDGSPMVGGKLCTYAANTSTPLATYTSSTAGTPNTNPIILDAAGRASVWVGPSLYKFVLRTGGTANSCNDGTIVWTQDNVADTTLYFVNYVKTIGTSTLITYTNPRTGGVTRTVSSRLADAVDAADFGMVCDGATDGRAALALALGSGGRAVRLPEGTCVLGQADVGVTTFKAGVQIPSNSTLIFSPGTILQAKTAYQANSFLISMYGVDNVTIYGQGGIAEMLKSEYMSGEQRHTVFIGQSTNIAIYDLTARDSGGDNFLIQGAIGGGGTKSENVLLVNCVADNARRNGLSITHAKGVRVLGGVYKNSIGTSPEVGIDIEPNANEDVIGAELLNVTTSGNNASGLLLAPVYAAVSQGRVYSVSVRNFVSTGDGASDSLTSNGITFANGNQVAVYDVAGMVVIDGATIDQPWATGIGIIRWDSHMPPVFIKNVTVKDPNRTGAGLYQPGNVGWSSPERVLGANSGFVVSTTTGEPASALTGYIQFDNCTAIDTRASPTMNLGFYLHGITQGINALVRNPQALNYTLSATNSPVNWNTGAGDVIYDVKPIITPSGSFSPEPFIGYEIQAQAGANLTLGTEGNVVGAHYYFRAIGGGFTVDPNIADTIDIFPLVAGEAITVASTGRGIRAIALRSGGNNTWLVDNWVSYYPANGPLYLVGGTVGGDPAGPNDANSLACSSQNDAPAPIRCSFGAGAGSRWDFGYHTNVTDPTTWVKTSSIYDNGRYDMTALQVGGGMLIVKIATGGVNFDPGNLADGAVDSVNVTVTGATVTSACSGSFDSIGARNYLVSSNVTTTNTVRFVIMNKTGGASDLASGSVWVSCLIQ